jgi:uncharacterized beta-barrel protein YwiB (DUF1934 family)
VFDKKEGSWPVQITLICKRYERPTDGEFDPTVRETDPGKLTGRRKAEPAQEDLIEMTTEGTLRRSGGVTEIAYEETELSGMEGSHTTLSFREDEPLCLTMQRSGTVFTILTFEPGRRGMSTYRMEAYAFELGIYTHAVRNDLFEKGTVYLDYQTELHGSRLERVRMHVRVRPDRSRMQPET